MSDLAARFGTTSRRRQLMRNLIAYRGLLTSEGYVNGIQFVDGSFVENLEAVSREPNDIDVFSLLSLPGKYASDPVAWQTFGFPFWRTEITDANRNKARFSIDTYGVLYEEIQAQPMALIGSIIYWYGLFSHQRDTLAWKGFAGIPLDPAGDQAALSALGSS